MQTLYYVAPSSSLILLPDAYTGTPATIVSWSVDTLIVSSSLGEIVALSGSLTVASFPIAGTNLFYSQAPIRATSQIQTVANSYAPIGIAYSVLDEQITSANKFTLTTGSTVIVSQSAYALDGGATIVVGDRYVATVSGSGEFYDLALVVTNLSTLTSSSVSSTTAPISISFSASAPTDLFSITATTDILPYIKTTFTSSASIPVSPTSSIVAWNTYLNISGSYVTSSLNTFYIVGGNLRTATSSIVITGSGLSNYSSFQTNNISTYYLNNNKLDSFPNIVTASSTTYFNVDLNLISGSLPNLTTAQSTNLTTFIASNNRLSGSIPALSSSINLTHFDVNTNYLTGALDLSKCYNLSYLDTSNNQLSGSFTLLDDIGSAPANIGNIRHFDISNNYVSGVSNNRFTGSITSFANYRLQHFNCSNNNFSGSLPYLQTVEIEFSPTGSLLYFNSSNNYFTGTINLIDYRYTLQTFIANDNQLNNYSLISGSVTPIYNALTTFNVQNNLLPSGSIDNILLDLDASGIVSGTVNLSGSGNQPPTTTGLTYTSSLKTKGWTVYVN